MSSVPTHVKAWLNAETLTDLIKWNTATSLLLNIHCLPWFVPEMHPKAQQINTIPRKSISIQCSTIPNKDKHYGLNHFILSNACIVVSAMLVKYLKCFGVKAKLVNGFLKPDNHPDGDVAIPHVYLEIDGYLIDNSFIHIEQDDTPEQNLSTFIAMFTSGPLVRDTKIYYRNTPGKIADKILYGDDGPVDLTNFSNICGSLHNTNKFLAQAKYQVDINPGTFVYDNIMREFLREEFGVVVEDVADVMGRICWNCERQSSQLKRCTGCKVAKYCNKTCLAQDWKSMHKRMHKLNKMYTHKYM